MNDIFVRIYRFLLKHLAVTAVVSILLVAVSVFFVTRISFTEDVSTLIPRDERINAIADVFNSSELAERIVITFSLRDTTKVDEDKLLEGAELFYQSVTRDSSLIEEIDFLVDQSTIMGLFDFVQENLPFYMDEADYQRLDSILSPEIIHAQVESGYRTLISPAGIATRKFFFSDPLNIASTALSKLSAFNIDENFEVYRGHIFTSDHKHLMMFINPQYPSSNTMENGRLADIISESTDSLEFAIPDLKVSAYGGTLVAVENSRQVKQDILVTVSMSIIFLCILFRLYFRKLRMIFMLFIPACIGGLIALLGVSLIMGEVSIIALGVGAILLCITIDYSLHIFAHAREANSVLESLKKVSMPVFLSALTTAAALLCIYVLRSEALKQLSLFSTLGILVSCLIALTALPILARNFKFDSGNRGAELFDSLVKPDLHSRNILVGIVLILTVVFAVSVKRLGFNSDISALNYQSEELTAAQNDLMKISAQANSAVFVFSHGESLSEAIDKSEESLEFLNGIVKDGYARSLTSAVKLIPGSKTQQQKIERWTSYWTSEKKQMLRSALIEAGKSFKIKEEAFGRFYSLLDAEFEVKDASHFSPVIDAFLKNFISESGGEYYVASVLKAEPDKKPQLINVLTDDPELVIFDQQLMINRLLDILREDFNRLSWLSMLIVFVILLLFFGRMELAVVTFIPILTGWIWTLGIMGLTGIEFNIFNVIISSLIFGLGLDYSILLVSGMIDNYKYGGDHLPRYKVSVLMSALTTIGGFGVLVFAGHPAIKSIALVSIIGISSVLIISFILTPRLFRYLVYSKGVRRRQPLCFADAALSGATLIGFLVLALILTLLVPLLAVLPISRVSKKAAMAYLIHQSSKLVVAMVFPIKKCVIGKEKADVSKPAVIISNHQSHLDLAILLAHYPKLIVFTNRWVYYNVFYGAFIRFADYYPAFKGFEQGVDFLRDRIANGYSILIFPEGSRSADGKIHRFHQGAFAVADALGLEIQPVMMHGAHHVLPKSEFLLRRGQISLKFFDKIKPQGSMTSGGISYLSQAQELTAFYRREFAALSAELETTDYMRMPLIHRYIFKGPVLEWYMRVKLNLEKDYRFFNEIVPRDARIIDVGCGYGFLSGMLALTSSGRTITGVDYDEEKIMMARNAFLDRPSVSFRCMDIAKEELPEGDVYIFSDVLHYLPENTQRSTVEACLRRLPAEGMIIIRDADTDRKKGTYFTKLTEFFSTKLLKFNKTDYGLTFVSGSLVKELARNEGFECKVYDNAYLGTSNMTYVITKQQ